MHTGFWRESQKGRLDTGGEDNGKMDLREIGRSGMGWIHLVLDKDQWRALANTVINLWGL
jgi:hypothetical protein